MKKKYLLASLLAILAAGIYLYYFHARIYQEISKANLKSPDKNQTFLIGADMDFQKNIVYAALGDSLTAGVGVLNYEESFPYLIAGKMAQDGKKVTLKDHSIPGAKVGDLKDKLVSAAIADNPDIITILAGVNDVHGKVSLAEFKNSYGAILKRLTEETDAKIYLVSIPFIGAPSLMMPPYNLYIDWQTKKFNSVIKALAETYKAQYIDLYSPTAAQFKTNGAHYSPDLFHPSAEGYAIWAKIIYGYFDK
ncbi:MAG: SGNH/GDSL hydrolase family protein [Patescibacteria group bacterium]